jgi:hypothetical protein
MFIEVWDNDLRKWIANQDGDPPQDLESALRGGGTDSWRDILMDSAQLLHGRERQALAATQYSYLGHADDPVYMWENFGLRSRAVTSWGEPHDSRMDRIWTARQSDLEDYDFEEAAEGPQWFAEWLQTAEQEAHDTYAWFVYEAMQVRGEAAQAWQQEMAELDEEVRVDNIMQLRLDQLEWAPLNEASHAALTAAGRNGKAATLSFHQLAEYLIIESDDQDPAYIELLKSHGSSEGAITVRSHGGLTSHGKIHVTGSPDHAGFKRGLRRFSKKEIEFVD